MAQKKSWLDRQFIEAGETYTFQVIYYLQRKVDEILTIFSMMSGMWALVSLGGVIFTPDPIGWVWLFGLVMSLQGLVVSEIFRVKFSARLATLMDRETKRMQTVGYVDLVTARRDQAFIDKAFEQRA